MHITLIQAILIGVWTAFCYAGLLWGIYTNRAIVLSFGVGVILGDISTALQAGAIAELAFMGFGVGAGGTVPPNPIGPGIVGTLLAITVPEVTPDSALAISIPFAVAIQFLQTFIFTVCAGLPETAINALKKKDYVKYYISSNLTLVLFIIVGFLLGFLAAFSMPTLQYLVSLIPAWLLVGLSVAGKMLPAIGFAMIMSVMLKKDFIPYAILGYVLAAFLKLPVIGIALVGAIFALKHYNDVNKYKAANVNNDKKEDKHDDWI